MSGDPVPYVWWVLALVALVALFGTYLSWMSARVERLHLRVESAARALDAHLVRRAAAAAVLAEQVGAVELYAAARIALDAGPGEREIAENDLTRQLRTLSLRDGQSADAVVAASRRLALARQVHTDLVRDALIARGRPLVRVFRMARRHERPRYFDVDDPTLPTPPVAAPGI